MDFAAQLNKLKRSATNVQRQGEERAPKRQRENGDSVLREKLESLAKEKVLSPASASSSADSTVEQSNNGDQQRSGRHIALLFITIADLPHEEIWKEFINFWDDAQEDNNLTISVLCHAKYPSRVRSPWLRKHLLSSSSHCPEWGSVEITRAMIDLVAEGLRGTERFIVKKPLQHASGKTEDDSSKGDVKVVIDTNKNSDCEMEKTTTKYSSAPPDRFVFLSETCLPVCTMKEVETAIYEKEASWLNARNSPNNGYAKQLQWDKMGPSMPRTKICKADQWVMLTRSHAKAVIEIPSKIGEPLWPQFRRTKASDELYFPTSLALLDVLKFKDGSLDGDLRGEEVLKRRLTYCDWESAKNPVTFHGISHFRDVFAKARGEGCLFARKFSSNQIYVSDWKATVLNKTKTKAANDV
mmetsp:Transcript_7774/g.11483  ORF Transcript_7774/g.11483 Transcript_7774/m.11483 type:complete len:412 (+) Transcript_7774:64-1299(+)|eukprot:CAMPEP_0196805002 /NCGR_PEP_ID=MMETSP1362-20130617/4709_1 /TAXON_ID=163516 /ORGANISM="Leptocylindrus danicus, Strain CCMP1856" /LENGTH=411 /DNA_ID=CAMNT_0042177629 /DNA_START=1 /DNA_END=1236 /DNA_ORIENTATION=-